MAGLGSLGGGFRGLIRLQFKALARTTVLNPRAESLKGLEPADTVLLRIGEAGKLGNCEILCFIFSLFASV